MDVTAHATTVTAHTSTLKEHIEAVTAHINPFQAPATSVEKWRNPFSLLNLQPTTKNNTMRQPLTLRVRTIQMHLTSKKNWTLFVGKKIDEFNVSMLLVRFNWEARMPEGVCFFLQNKK